MASQYTGPSINRACRDVTELLRNDGNAMSGNIWFYVRTMELGASINEAWEALTKF